MRIKLIAAALALCMCAALELPAAAEYGSKTPESTAINVDITGRSEGFSAVLYDNLNGLPTSEANAIAETSDGFIWIGSYSGLIRYDGCHFERMGSSSGMSSVVCLFVDSADRLWVGTNDSGAAVISDGVKHMFGKHDGLGSLSVRDVTEDNEGMIYIATTQGVCTIDSDMNVIPIDDSRINEKYVRDLSTGSNGVIYGLTLDGDIFTLSGGRVSGFYNTEELGVEDIHAIAPDPDNPGYIFAGSKGSLLYYGRPEDGFGEAMPMNAAPLSYINSIKRIGDCTWLCADNGAGYLRDGDAEVTMVENVPMKTSIENMMVDYQGNPWFVSSKQGVMKVVKNQFSDIFDKYELEDEVVYSTCMVDGKLFVGTKNNGLYVLENGKRIESMPIESSATASGLECDDKDLLTMLEGCRIRSIIRDSKGRIWISTFGKNPIVRYENGKVVKFTVLDGLPSDRVRTVYERDDGSFVAVCTGGAAIIEGDKVTKVYGDDCGIANSEMLTASEDFDGNIIVGTDGGGMYIIGDKGMEHIGVDEGLSSDVVMRIKRDNQRELCWIVTSNSIAYMTSDHQITTIHDFPYSNNFDLYENSRGDMWVLSSNGIYVTSVEQLIANKKISAVYYGMDNGLSCITTSNSYSDITPEGDLYISGTTGISKVNIEKPFEDVADIKMAVPFIEADGVTMYPDDEGNYHVTADVRKVTIDCFVYNYSLMNPQVTYCLEGFEEVSKTVRRSELDPIDYTNLHGGVYDFVMRVTDPYGNSSRELRITLVKDKKVYEKIWFNVAVLLALLAVLSLIVTLLIRYRTKSFLKREQENKLLIREIVEAFAKVIDMKDKYTNGHSTRVAEYTAMLTRELGYSEEIVEKYYNIALLHDIGKVGVPPEVLNKPGKLTDTEFNIIKSHSALGYNALKNISIMPELAIGAGAHHERPDGKGYPKGLKGDEIPRVAQIIAVADTFDAMYSDRPYRKRMNFDKAVSIISEAHGTQLTSDVVDAFMRLVDKGEFRSPDDTGGGTTEDIDNIRKKFQ